MAKTGFEKDENTILNLLERVEELEDKVRKMEYHAEIQRAVERERNKYYD